MSVSGAFFCLRFSVHAYFYPYSLILFMFSLGVTAKIPRVLFCLSFIEPLDTSVTDTHDSIAAIDLGSNSFHMLLARLDNDQLQVIDRHKEMVRLAGGLDEKNCLDEKVMQRAIDCLEKFGQRIRSLPEENVRIIGTNTLRKAKNAKDFLRRAEQALGHPVEIVSGREEARLVYLGVAHGLPVDGKQRLVVDIGGGSTEIIVGRDFDTQMRESLSMGCVSMTKLWFEDGVIKPKAWRKAVMQARLELLPVASNYVQLGWSYAVGASGTMRSVAAVMKAEGWSNGEITRDALGKLVEKVLAAENIKALKLEGLSEDRRPVFVGGLAVVQALFDGLGINSMMPAQGALREGALYDLSGRLDHDDVRGRTISTLMERFVLYPAQADRVKTTVIKLLKMSTNSCGLGKPDRRLLRWAAQLHEVGLRVAHTGYHKHGAYFVGHADMPGFSSSEQKTLALLIRSQRKKISSSLFVDLSENDRDDIIKMMILLRLALLLRRDRQDTWIPLTDFQSDGKDVVLAFKENWLAEFPLTRADLEQEAKFLKGLGVSLSVA